MNKLMVEQAGARFFDIASSLGRMHVETLTGLADATAKTPFGPAFAVNATVARMVNEGVESIAHRFTGESGTSAEAPVVKAEVKTAKAPKARKTVAKAKKPAKPSKPAAEESFEADAAANTALSLAIEPEADDVLIDEASVTDAIASVDIEAVAEADDLTVISGIGVTTAKKLNGVGIKQFADIAVMSENKFADLLASLDIKSIRFSPAKWIEEAKMFAAQSN